MLNKMKDLDLNVVYVVQADGSACGWDPDEVRSLGVYSTFEKAQEVALNYKELNRVQGVDVYEINIDDQQLGFGNPVWYWDRQNKKGIFWGDAAQRLQKAVDPDTERVYNDRAMRDMTIYTVLIDNDETGGGGLYARVYGVYDNEQQAREQAQDASKHCDFVTVQKSKLGAPGVCDHTIELESIVVEYEFEKELD